MRVDVTCPSSSELSYKYRHRVVKVGLQHEAPIYLPITFPLKVPNGSLVRWVWHQTLFILGLFFSAVSVENKTQSDSFGSTSHSHPLLYLTTTWGEKTKETYADFRFHFDGHFPFSEVLSFLDSCSCISAGNSSCSFLKASKQEFQSFSIKHVIWQLITRRALPWNLLSFWVFILILCPGIGANESL